MRVTLLALLFAAAWAIATAPVSALAPSGQTDLSIGLETPVPSMAIGERRVIVAVVTNHSRVDARNVTALLSIPQGLQPEPMFGNGAWRSCTQVDAHLSANRWVCTRLLVEAGKSYTLSVPAKAVTAVFGPVTIGMAVTTDTPDYALSNNYSAPVIEVRP